MKLTPSILPSTPVLGRGIWLVGQGRVGWLWGMAGNGCGCVVWIGCSACWFDWVGWVLGCSNFGFLLVLLAIGLLVVVVIGWVVGNCGGFGCGWFWGNGFRVVVVVSCVFWLATLVVVIGGLIWALVGLLGLVFGLGVG